MSKLTDDQIKQFKHVFSLFDTNKDGHITKVELREALTQLRAPFPPSCPRLPGAPVPFAGLQCSF